MNYVSPLSGKQQTLTLGKYPAIGIAEARRLRDEAKELLAKSIDPGEAKKETKAERYSLVCSFLCQWKHI